MLVKLSGMWDGGRLGYDSGSVQPLQSRGAGPLGRPDPGNGWVGLQDESGQGLSQSAFPTSILHV